MGRFIDLTEQRFDRLIVIKQASKDKWRNILWSCLCDCGQEKIIRGSHLKSGATKSCGCLHEEKITKHGHNKTKTYCSWAHVIQRCTNPKTENYDDYGGRGITVCRRWLKFNNFLKDMGESPEGYSIDRIDNNKGYKKSNCRWATRKQQTRNMRNNLYFTYKNKTQLLIELAEEYNINYRTLHNRIFRLGWSIEKALTTPVKKRKK